MTGPDAMRPLAELTAVVPDGDGRWTARLGEEAQIPGGLVNGGMLLVVAARALAIATGRPHPVTITGHFLTAVRPGPVAVEVEVLRPGRHAYARALMRLPDGTPVLAVTGTFTDLATASGPTLELSPPPPLPDPATTVPWPPRDDAEDVEEQPPNVFRRFDHHVVPDGWSWARGAPSGTTVVESLATPAVGTWDPLDLLVLVDVFPPPVFNSGMLPVAWVPTLELTVQLRGLPRPDERVACRFWTTSVTHGYLEEDGLVRGDDGRLLVVSRQLALAPRTGG